MNDSTPFSASDDYRLGETPGQHAVETIAEARDAALALARQARFALRIFSRDLDAAILSTREFSDAASDLARRGRQTEVRILVLDPSTAVRRHHELIGLAQHLSSHVGVRRVGRDWQDEICAFVLADEQGLLWRPYGDRYEGHVDFSAGPRGRELRTWFDHVWDASEPDPEFRRLGI